MPGGHDKGRNLKNWLVCATCGSRGDPVYVKRGGRMEATEYVYCPQCDGFRLKTSPQIHDEMETARQDGIEEARRQRIDTRARAYGWKDGDPRYVYEDEYGELDLIIFRDGAPWYNWGKILAVCDDGDAHIFWNWRKGQFLRASDGTFSIVPESDAPQKWRKLRDAKCDPS